MLEPALGPAGALETAREGTGRFALTVRGRSAHSGLDPEEGACAIVALSELVQALHAMNDPWRGITVNVGTLEGGRRTSVIAGREASVARRGTARAAAGIWLEEGRSGGASDGNFAAQHAPTLDGLGAVGGSRCTGWPRWRARWSPRCSRPRACRSRLWAGSRASAAATAGRGEPGADRADGDRRDSPHGTPSAVLNGR